MPLLNRPTLRRVLTADEPEEPPVYYDLLGLGARQVARGLGWMEQQSKTIVVGVNGIAMVAFGFIQARLDADLSFSLFYLLPITIVGWVVGRTAGIFFSLLAVVIWLSANTLAGAAFVPEWVPIWNTVARLLFFMAVVTLVAELKGALVRERRLARTDPVTGIRNSRAFVEAAELEISRARRHGRPFTLAYLDLDNFKEVNDVHGHEAGDHLLRVVGQTLEKSTRETDLVARLGGDEFVMLFPESGVEVARPMVERVHRHLVQVSAEAGWPVTFSVGAVVCPADTADLPDALHAADDLMYRVKRSGKGMALVEDQTTITSA